MFVEVVILEEKAATDHGSIWLCSVCDLTFFQHDEPTHCPHCKRPVQKRIKHSDIH